MSVKSRIPALQALLQGKITLLKVVQICGGLSTEGKLSTVTCSWWAPHLPEQQILCQSCVIHCRAGSGVFWAQCILWEENGHRTLIKWLFMCVCMYLFRLRIHLHCIHWALGQILSHCLHAHKYLSKGMGLNWLTQTSASSYVGTNIGLIPYTEVLWSWLRSCTDPLLWE